MKLPDKYGQRLRTTNFRRVTSKAIISIDYYPKLEIIEIEFRNGKIYHYKQMSRTIWGTFLEFADKTKGLGTYINQDFKQIIDENDFDYYELIVVHKPHPKSSSKEKDKEY